MNSSYLTSQSHVGFVNLNQINYSKTNERVREREEEEEEKKIPRRDSSYSRTYLCEKKGLLSEI